MPAGMLLRSEGFASSFSDPTGDFTMATFASSTGRDIGRYGHPIPVEDFCDYASWFIESAGVKVEETNVEHLTRDGRRFRVELSTGESLLANRVVVAVGTTHYAYVPPTLRKAGEHVTHVSRHHDLAPFRGRDVTVVGAGQSATEMAALLRESGAEVRLVGRRATTWLPKPVPLERPLWKRLRRPIAGLSPGWESWAFEHLANGYRFLPPQRRVYLAKKKHGPGGAWWLHDRVVGQVPVLTGRTVHSATATPSGVQLTFNLSDGSRDVIDTEHVISATGYRVDLHSLRFLDPSLRRDLRTLGGAPVLAAGLQSSVPNLYFLGISAAMSFGPVLRFVVGTEAASPMISRHLASSTRRRIF